MRMVESVDVVYVNGLTIKDRSKNTTHPNCDVVLRNIDEYTIISFNRNSDWGPTYLVLSSTYRQ